MGGWYGANLQGPPFGHNSPTASNWVMPVNAYLYNLMTCMEGANGVNGRTSSIWGITNLSGTVDAVTDTIYTFSNPFDAALPCQGQTLKEFPISKGQALRQVSIENGSTQGNLAGWAAQVIGTTIQPAGAFLAVSEPGAGATQYTSIGQQSLLRNTETDVIVPIPIAATLNQVCVTTTGTQPATGTLVFTARDTGVDTTVIITIPASGQAGAYCSDPSLTHVFSAGDYFTVSVTNNAASATVTIQNLSLYFTPTASGRAILWFPNGVNVLTASANNYSPSFVRLNSVSTSETANRSPMPIAGTMQNLYCYVTTAPAANSTVNTVQRNGSNGSVTLTITTGGGTGMKQGTGTQAYVAGDSFNMNMVPGAGAVPVIPGCAAEYVY
jgi:hypothetical protein